MVTLLFGIALVCMVPLRVDANGNVALQKDYFRTTSGIQVDSKELANYRFDVLESNVVPLSSGTGDYTESALHVVLVCFIFALVALYVFWFLGHKKRIEFLIGNFKLGAD